MTLDVSRDDWARLLDQLDEPPVGVVAEALADARDVDVGAAYDAVEAGLEAGDLVEEDTSATPSARAASAVSPWGSSSVFSVPRRSLAGVSGVSSVSSVSVLDPARSARTIACSTASDAVRSAGRYHSPSASSWCVANGGPNRADARSVSAASRARTMSSV